MKEIGQVLTSSYPLELVSVSLSAGSPLVQFAVDEGGARPHKEPSRRRLVSCMANPNRLGPHGTWRSRACRLGGRRRPVPVRPCESAPAHFSKTLVSSSARISPARP